MERRKFLRNSLLASALLAVKPNNLLAKETDKSNINSKAKNIIFMISDGMSTGTLAMADLYSRNILGQNSNWMNLYLENKVSRALMYTASLSSIVTDSAAASSAFGGGHLVKNGSLNIGPNGENYTPIWQQWKKNGKKAGCITSVTITHATPAGFCINSSSRNSEPEIAEMYAEIGFDVMMGGGDEFFNQTKREDKRDIYNTYIQKNYQIIKNRNDFQKIKRGKPLLGIFNTGALPYYIDWKNDKSLQNIPTLSEMTSVAIEQMKDHKEGFVLQIEGGKVDWAAHANDTPALIHEQLAFDEAIKVVMDFAEKDKNTLVVITTDHGNANPGVIYDKDATKKFETISQYKCSNENTLNSLNSDFSIKHIKELIFDKNNFELNNKEAIDLLSFYNGLEKEEGLYNYKKIPYKLFSDIQKKHNSVGWIGMDHSSDFVELAMYGPGSNLLKPFVKNTDVHQLIQEALS